jgi:hypothetical protein
MNLPDFRPTRIFGLRTASGVKPRVIEREGEVGVADGCSRLGTASRFLDVRVMGTRTPADGVVSRSCAEPGACGRAEGCDETCEASRVAVTMKRMIVRQMYGPIRGISTGSCRRDSVVVLVHASWVEALHEEFSKDLSDRGAHSRIEPVARASESLGARSESWVTTGWDAASEM